MTALGTLAYGSPSLAGNAASTDPLLLADGGILAFTSRATNLVEGTATAGTRLYLQDLSSGGLSVVEFGAAGSGITLIPALVSFSPGLFALSADATTLAYATSRADLVPGDTNGRVDLFVKDLDSGSLARFDASLFGAGSILDVSISADGSKIAVYSLAGRSGDIGILDLATGAVTKADLDAAGRDVSLAFAPTLSGDGTVLAFSSGTSGEQLFVRDLASGSVSQLITGGTRDLSISEDGSRVSFVTPFQLVAGDTNNVSDVYVYDVATGRLILASSDANGFSGNGAARGGALTADGSAIAFSSTSGNLVAGDTNGVEDIFLKNLETGAIIRLTGGETQFNGGSSLPTISPDGTVVAFASTASNILPGDTNGVGDVFVATSGPSVLTLTFDEIALGDGAEQRIADGYGGFTWVQAGIYNPDGTYGYLQGSGNNLAFIAEAGDFEVAGYEDAAHGAPLVFTRGTAFDLLGARFSSAYQEGLLITARAYADEAGTQLVGELQFRAGLNALTDIDFAGGAAAGRFSGIRRVELNGNDGDISTRDYFGLDDLQVRVSDAPLI